MPPPACEPGPRMTPLAAVLIHEQLPRLEGKVAALNSHYGLLEARLGQPLASMHLLVSFVWEVVILPVACVENFQ